MDWQEVRAQFAVAQDYIYFDLANKCALPLFSTAAIADYVDKQQRFGGDKNEWFETLEEARANFAQLINAHPDEIAFTKNTSEGLNIAANCLPLQPGDTVLLNENEHPNNVYCWLNLEKRGVRVKWIPTEGGQVTVDALEEVVDDSTRVLSVSSTTYAPGTRNDIKRLVKLCRERGIYTVVDAVQSVGTMQVDVKDWGVDVLCTSGHKSLFCPHGVGLVYVRREIMDQLEPVYVARAGMGMAAQIEYDRITYKLDQAHSARKFEIGNYNYLGITVLNHSLKFLLGLGMQRVEARLLSLNEYLGNALQAAGFTVASPLLGPWRSAILCFQAEGARELHGYLMEHKAITTLRRNMIRASLGIYNNREDVDAFVQLLEQWKRARG
ncbi:MAG: aminotransferase class V-fold PLP-dependent enzyme [Bacillota bacterium]|jgi:cysteine desulfurase/selenocysteine lyase